MQGTTIRSAFVTVAMAASAVLTSVLAVQAVGAARDRATTARSVLLDYAALGAEQASARLGNRLGATSYAILWAAGRPGVEGSSMERVAEAVPDDARALLARLTLLHIDSTGTVTSSGQAPEAGVTEAVLVASRLLPPDSRYGMTWIGDSAHGRQLLVFAPRDARSGSTPAFTLSPTELDRFLKAEMVRGPLLPPSLTHGRSIASGFGVRLVGDGERTIIDSGFVAASPFRVAHPLGRWFGDLAVEASLDAALAPTLIIGGLPPNRAPLLFAAAAVTLLLMMAAFHQLRRERALARIQEDFVASVSHELRTPLAQIRMFAETLQLGRVRSPEEASDYLGIIEKESRRLTHLVDNLLHFSRATRKRFVIAPVMLDSAALLRSIVAEFEPLAASRRNTIALDLAGDAGAEIDEAAFRQVMLNLLDNAVRYGPAGQTITVRLHGSAESVQVEVEDQGAGVPPGIRSQVWKRFWRGELARHPAVTGTGLGLAIVHDLMQLHGGSAAVEDGAGGGARFIVTFPRRHAA
jgi:signal transduction histidine kinase